MAENKLADLSMDFAVSILKVTDGTLGKHRITRGTKWSNIILSEAKNIISPRGDASLRYTRLRLDLFAIV